MKNKNETYNGWSNRETWATYLNLSSCGLGNQLSEVGEHCQSKYAAEERALAVADMAEHLHDVLNELRSNREVCSDLIHVFDEIGSLWRVDLHELAESFLP